MPRSVIAVIPARAGSKGIKFKNKQEINNKSLVEHAVDFALSLGMFETIVVSSDIVGLPEVGGLSDKPIAWHRRSAFAAADSASDFDVLLDLREAGLLDGVAVVAWLRPTSPIRLIEDLRKCLMSDLIEKYGSVRSVTPVPEAYSPFWSGTINNEGLWMPVIKDAAFEKYYQRHLLPQAYIPNCHFELIEVDKAFEQQKFYPLPIGGFVTEIRGVDINNQSDLELARREFDLSFNYGV